MDTTDRSPAHPSITARAARGFGRRAARDDVRDDAGAALERDLALYPGIRPHAEEYLRAFWDEKIATDHPALYELLGGLARLGAIALVVVVLGGLVGCGDDLAAPAGGGSSSALTCADYKQLEPIDDTVQCLIDGHVDSVPGVAYRASNGDTWVQTVYELDGRLGTWGRRDISQASACEWFDCIAVCDWSEGACP